MNILPYKIVITNYCSESASFSDTTINIPKYFANYKYFKIILKQVSIEERNLELWLCCDNISYNQVYQESSKNIYIDKFLFNLTAFREGCTSSNYQILPYKDKITLSLCLTSGNKLGTLNTVGFILELEPYEI